MGPPPKENRVRRNLGPAEVTLPAQGRTDPAPAWPLLPDVVLTARRDIAGAKAERLRYALNEAEDANRGIAAAERRLDDALERLAVIEAQLAAQRDLEATLWSDLWRLPQAVEWERQQWLRDVAQYVRHKTLAELGDMDAAREARQWSDRLGLSPMALLRLRWKIAADEVAAKRDERGAGARGRLRAVDSA